MSQLPSEDDIKQLADCFYANIDSPGTDFPELRSKIKHLPRHLRSSRTIDHIFHKRRDGGDLCSVHKGLNSETTSIIFGSLRTELTSTIKHMRQYAFIFGPDDSMTLDRVAAIEEMWKENTSTSNTSQNNTNNLNTTRWRHQADQCEACMLSRIATYPSALRELRTLFLAHRPISPGRPIIHAFVEEWIKLTDQRKSLFEMSSQRAAVMRDAIYEWNNSSSKPRNLEYSHFQESYLGKNQDKPATTTRLPKSRAPVAQGGPGSPIFSSTLSRPLSRNANELSETEFLREFSASKGFYRAPPGDDYPSYIPRDNNPARTERAQQRQYQDRQGTPDTGPSSTLYSPWSSTDELRGPPHSRFSHSTTSSPSNYSERVYHTPQPKSSLPNPRTPDRNKLLPPVPNVSPFAVSPPFSRAYSGGSAWSSGEEVVGTRLQMTRMDNQPRLVDVRAAAERGRYIPR